MGMGIATDLRHAAEWLAAAANEGMKPERVNPYRQLRAAAVEVGRAWCGSWLPNFSAYYDRDLLALPLHLRVEAAASPDRLPPALELSCCRWTQQQIVQAIRSRAGQPDDSGLREASAAATSMLNDAFVAAVAALECATAERPADPRLASHLLAVRQIEITDAAIFVERCRPVLTHLQGAASADPPPHIVELARLEALYSPFEALRQVASLMRSAAVHLECRLSAPLLAAGPRPWLRPAGAGPDTDIPQAPHLPRASVNPMGNGLTTTETTGER